MWNTVPATWPKRVAVDCAKSVQDDLGAHVVGDREPEHPRRALVADGAHVGLAITDAHIGDVRSPQFVDAVGVEVPVHQVRRVAGGGSGLVVTLNSLGLTPTMPRLAMRAATVLWLTRSPASCRSVVIRGDP